MLGLQKYFDKNVLNLFAPCLFWHPPSRHQKTGGPWWGAYIKGLENQEAVVLLNISTTTVYFDVK